MRTATIKTQCGHAWTTSINGTDEEILAYFRIGKEINIGNDEDRIAIIKSVEIDGKEYNTTPRYAVIYTTKDGGFSQFNHNRTYETFSQAEAQVEAIKTNNTRKQLDDCFGPQAFDSFRVAECLCFANGQIAEMVTL